MTDYDSPWKEVLDCYFEAFMAFCFPQAHAEIDWSRGYEFLDKELQQVVRDKEKRMPYVTSFEEMGIQKGLHRGLLKGIEPLLEMKFGAAGCN